MLTPKHYEKEPYPKLSLSLCFKAVGAFLKDLACSYTFEFSNSKVGANMMVLQLARTAHNCLA